MMASMERVGRSFGELKLRVDHLNRTVPFHSSSSSSMAMEFNCEDFVQEASDVSEIIDVAIYSSQDADPHRFSDDDEEPLVQEPVAKKARGKANASKGKGKGDKVTKKPARRT